MQTFLIITAIIISRRTNTWKRSRAFYPTFYRFYDATFGKLVTPNFDYAKCPACTSKYSEKNPIKSFKIKKYDGEKIYSSICTDCHQDTKSTEEE